MTAQLIIDQAGLPAGTINESRSDGLSSGATVTLTSAGPGISHDFVLLWVPEDDTTAVSTFVQAGNTATFDPDPTSAGGTYRIRLRVTDASGTTEVIRLFSVLTSNGLRIPALNEKSDETASLENNGVDTVEASEFNEPGTGPFVAGNYGGWYTAIADLIRYVDAIPPGITAPGSTDLHALATWGDANGDSLQNTTIFLDAGVIYAADGVNTAGELVLRSGSNSGVGNGAPIEVSGGDSVDSMGGSVMLTPGNGVQGGHIDLYPGRGTGGPTDDGVVFVRRNVTDNRSVRMRFEAGDGTYVDFKAPAAATSHEITLPTTQGAANSFLMNDGTGVSSWSTITEEMITPAFAIASFAKTAPGGATVTYRRGDTITGATVAATYTSGPPNSASIANTYSGSTDVGDVDPGVWTINTPFATGSLAGSITRNGSDAGADPQWIITLTATKATVQTSTVTVRWTRDVYYGLGVAGLSTEADIEALSGTTLATSRARTITVSPSNQKVYYAYPKSYGTATFTLSGFPAAFNAPSEVSVTNSNGVTSTYYLYESTNLLTGSNLAFVVT